MKKLAFYFLCLFSMVLLNSCTEQSLNDSSDDVEASSHNSNTRPNSMASSA